MSALDKFLAASTKKVTVFATHGCPYCTRSKQLLERLKIPFDYVILPEHPDGNAIFNEVEKRYKHDTYPINFIGTKFIGGNSDLQELHQAGKLLPMVNDSSKM